MTQLRFTGNATATATPSRCECSHPPADHDDDGCTGNVTINGQSQGALFLCDCLGFTAQEMT